MTKLHTVVALIRRQEEINEEVRALKRGRDIDVLSLHNSTAHADDERDQASPRSDAKARGKQRKAEFIAALSHRGMQLYQSRGAIFKAQTGLRVGIAYADERRKDRWFLGLPPDGFQHAVLLCEGGGKLNHFSLDKDFMAQFGRLLFRKNGQIKFNVSREGDDFILKIPRHDQVSIEPFRDNFFGLV